MNVSRCPKMILGKLNIELDRRNIKVNKNDTLDGG